MRLCKSSLTTKLVILGIMIFAIVTIVAMQPRINALKEESRCLDAQIRELQQTNLELEADLAAVGSDDWVRQVARDRLNMVEDDEVVFIDSRK